MADFTAETRLARLKEWANTKVAPANAKILEPGSNLLFGAAIHGISRRSKGAKDLTEIEKIGVRFFEILADDEDELKAYGEIFGEAKAKARSGVFAAANIPSSVMTLSEDTPYCEERFRDDVKELAVATLQQPHIRAVMPEQIKADGTIETTEEYDKATQELGRGVSLFTVGQESKISAADEERITSTMGGRIGPGGKIMIPMKIVPYIFKCYKKSGELTKDEIYFTWGFGGDGEYEVSHRTDEFGSVVTGTERTFPANPPFYLGYVEDACAGHIICWEADQSTSGWYDKLTNIMREIAVNATHATIHTGDKNWDFLIGLIPGPIGTSADIAFWLETIASLIANLLDIFRNHDDKVMEHSYGYGRDWLLQGVPKQWTVAYDFDGGDGGHFLAAATCQTAAELL
ncbi:hypothetical protein N7478_003899 [Penicillium angulare]|uniref:uncharacterized protein n=1 Tax=Penicillium angulare TaxID=116970 RepID=UPI00253F839E|nr:uncharacterized protein N7478_003899 [Penicillium angulare]KAJ5288213.1 hypothetical protein N7478_003899 [Penicillium angulare]